MRSWPNTEPGQPHDLGVDAHVRAHTARRTQHQDHKEWNLYSTYECQECDGEIRGVINAVRIGPVPEVESNEKPAAERAAGRPKPQSKAALRRRLREAEAQASALRVQLAELDEAAGTHGLAESSER